MVLHREMGAEHMENTAAWLSLIILSCPTAQFSPTCELSEEPSHIAGPGCSMKCIFVQLG